MAYFQRRTVSFREGNSQDCFQPCRVLSGWVWRWGWHLLPNCLLCKMAHFPVAKFLNLCRLGVSSWNSTVLWFCSPFLVRFFVGEERWFWPHRYTRGTSSPTPCNKTRRIAFWIWYGFHDPPSSSIWEAFTLLVLLHVDFESPGRSWCWIFTNLQWRKRLELDWEGGGNLGGEKLFRFGPSTCDKYKVKDGPWWICNLSGVWTSNLLILVYTISDHEEDYQFLEFLALNAALKMMASPQNTRWTWFVLGSETTSSLILA